MNSISCSNNYKDDIIDKLIEFSGDLAGELLDPTLTLDGKIKSMLTDSLFTGGKILLILYKFHLHKKLVDFFRKYILHPSRDHFHILFNKKEKEKLEIATDVLLVLDEKKSEKSFVLHIINSFMSLFLTALIKTLVMAFFAYLDRKHNPYGKVIFVIKFALVEFGYAFICDAISRFLSFFGPIGLHLMGIIDNYVRNALNNCADWLEDLITSKFNIEKYSLSYSDIWEMIKIELKERLNMF